MDVSKAIQDFSEESPESVLVQVQTLIDCVS